MWPSMTFKVIPKSYKKKLCIHNINIHKKFFLNSDNIMSIVLIKLQYKPEKNLKKANS